MVNKYKSTLLDCFRQVYRYWMAHEVDFYVFHWVASLTYLWLFATIPHRTPFR